MVDIDDMPPCVLPRPKRLGVPSWLHRSARSRARSAASAGPARSAPTLSAASVCSAGSARSARSVPSVGRAESLEPADMGWQGWPIQRRATGDGALGPPVRLGRAATRGTLVAEQRPRYEAGSGSAHKASRIPDAATPPIAAVEASVDVLAGTDLDALPDGGLDELLRRLRRPIAQLVALRSRAAADSQARRLSASPSMATGATLREHQRELAAGQRVSASQAKREIEAGRAARDHEATRAAFVDGAIDPEQTRMIARILQQLPLERRDELERELLALAGRLDPIAFGRAARSVLAKQAPVAAAQDERRRHLARRVRASDTSDGGFAFSGLLYGAAAEQARVALDAFRQPDVPGEHRSPEQRSADAFEQLCAAALRSGAAPSTHGVRPHVIVVIDAEQLTDRHAPGSVADGRFAWSGQPVTSQEFGSLLSDCDVTRLVLDAAGTPIEASEAVRTVPVGLWRSLLVRDGGCTWEGCDAPASWCDVAHGHTPFAAEGRLSPGNAALLCRRHHRRFDLGRHRIVIDGSSVSYLPVSAPVPDGGDGSDRADLPTLASDAGTAHRRDRGPAPPTPPSGQSGAWDQATLPGSDPP